MVCERPSKTVKFLCSYGGKIMPRQFDGNLRYVGGFTRILAVDPAISFAELMVKLQEFCGCSVNLKCLLPRGELDTLISLTSDEDLANLLEEYDRASLSLPHPLQVRAVLWPRKSLKKISPPPSYAPCFNPVASRSFFKGTVPHFPPPPPFHHNFPSPIRHQTNAAKIIAAEEHDVQNRLGVEIRCCCPYCSKHTRGS